MRLDPYLNDPEASFDVFSLAIFDSPEQRRMPVSIGNIGIYVSMSQQGIKCVRGLVLHGIEQGRFSFFQKVRESMSIQQLVNCIAFIVLNGIDKLVSGVSSNVGNGVGLGSVTVTITPSTFTDP